MNASPVLRRARRIVLAAHRTVRSVAPRAEMIACGGERPASRSMMWKLVRYAVDGQIVVTLGTFSEHASLFFAHGSALDDPGGLLEGTGKDLRYVTLRTPADAGRGMLKKVLRQAFAAAG